MAATQHTAEEVLGEVYPRPLVAPPAGISLLEVQPHTVLHHMVGAESTGSGSKGRRCPATSSHTDGSGRLIFSEAFGGQKSSRYECISNDDTMLSLSWDFFGRPLHVPFTVSE